MADIPFRRGEILLLLYLNLLKYLICPLEVVKEYIFLFIGQDSAINQRKLGYALELPIIITNLLEK